MPGFEPIPDDVLLGLGIVTGDDSLLPVRRMDVTKIEGKIVSTSGSYYMDENTLPKQLSNLLHGRAYIIDHETISNNSASSPITYYIAANKHKGLIVPGRSLFIEAIETVAHYRWTDDGIKWTEWTTIDNGSWHAYAPDEHCRFAEIQIYVDTINEKVSLRATR